ncbi:MAG: RsmB/NOP family class I SAM-dependent RNA methyltransferase [Clostridia bacterium]|nr:RsmB/NOP family class I SAM-dependent RNA methyltransferase [Clostridia bacterium]
MSTLNAYGFPEGWIEQLCPLLGDQLPDFLHALSEPPLRGVRMRGGAAPLLETGEKVPWARDAYYLPLDSDAGARPLHEAGAYYLQEPSAMTAAAALRPLPGERVLDLCAAPGGKSTQLAAMMSGEGLLVCNEPVPGRAQVLSRNLERMGVKNAVAVCSLPEELSPRWPEFFDKILVDAPCSGEGMFRRHPETRGEWTISAPAGCAGRQAHILRHAAMMLRPGGRLAYSTCTFNATENEGVVEAFLKEHPDFHLVPFSLPGLPACGGMLRVWPHLVKGEGHFAALLEKDGDAIKKQADFRLPTPGKQEITLTQAFLQEHIAEKIAPNAVFAGKVCAVPEELPSLKGVRVLRLGLQFGEVKGKIFLPGHALALACSSLRTIPVTEDQARLYQAGQALPVDDNLRGFYTPAFNGLNLGWGKASDGQLKNHYPKGLRK